MSSGFQIKINVMPFVDTHTNGGGDDNTHKSDAFKIRLEMR